MGKEKLSDLISGAPVRAEDEELDIEDEEPISQEQAEIEAERERAEESEDS